jgi:hypothetical protein
MSALSALVIIAVVAVGVILFFGLLNMVRGGSASRSQKLMRWRVAVQFIAICLIMASIFVAHQLSR